MAVVVFLGCGINLAPGAIVASSDARDAFCRRGGSDADKIVALVSGARLVVFIDTIFDEREPGPIPFENADALATFVEVWVSMFFTGANTFSHDAKNGILSWKAGDTRFVLLYNTPPGDPEGATLSLALSFADVLWVDAFLEETYPHADIVQASIWETDMPPGDRPLRARAGMCPITELILRD